MDVQYHTHADVLGIERHGNAFFALSHFICESQAQHRGLLFEENENFTTLECSQNRK